MIDDAIKTHLLSKAAEAYPTLDADQFIAKIVSGTAEVTTRSMNKRSNVENKFTLYETTVSVELIIASEEKVDRDDLIRLLPRGFVTLDGRKDIMQQYIRWVDSDFVEVINMKGVVHFIEYVYDVFQN